MYLYMQMFSLFSAGMSTRCGCVLVTATTEEQRGTNGCAVGSANTRFISRRPLCLLLFREMSTQTTDKSRAPHIGLSDRCRARSQVLKLSAKCQYDSVSMHNAHVTSRELASAAFQAENVFSLM